ncbi:MAG: hypothetical protein R2709_04445 [Marmoricola sp.]
MGVAGGDGGGFGAEGDVAGGGGGLVVADVGGVAVAQSPVATGAPAADVAGGEHGAGVGVAGGDGGGLGAERDAPGEEGDIPVADVVGVP